MIICRWGPDAPQAICFRTRACLTQPINFAPFLLWLCDVCSLLEFTNYQAANCRVACCLIIMFPCLLMLLLFSLCNCPIDWQLRVEFLKFSMARWQQGRLEIGICLCLVFLLGSRAFSSVLLSNHLVAATGNLEMECLPVHAMVSSTATIACFYFVSLAWFKLLIPKDQCFSSYQKKKNVPFSYWKLVPRLGQGNHNRCILIRLNLPSIAVHKPLTYHMETVFPFKLSIIFWMWKYSAWHVYIDSAKYTRIGSIA
jgi:hypothetical protein